MGTRHPSPPPPLPHLSVLLLPMLETPHCFATAPNPSPAIPFLFLLGFCSLFLLLVPVPACSSLPAVPSYSIGKVSPALHSPAFGFRRVFRQHPGKPPISLVVPLLAPLRCGMHSKRGL